MSIGGSTRSVVNRHTSDEWQILSILFGSLSQVTVKVISIYSAILKITSWKHGIICTMSE